MQSQQFPFSKLRLSPANVRKHYSQPGIVTLANSIQHLGLLQPVIVSPSAGKKSLLDVHAGSRRWRAIGLLIERGDLPKTHMVDVRLCENETILAEQISLAENIERENMTAADECAGFRALIDRGETEEDIAKRFSITVRQVQARLRLADLAEPIFEALATGAITLDVAKAYGSISDRDAQLATWNKFNGGHYAGNANMIRRDLADQAIDADSVIALLVGETAYRGAGGRIEQDLFASDGGQWLDRGIAEPIALAKLEEAGATFAQTHGLGWVRPVLDSYVPYTEHEPLRRYPIQRAPASDEAQARMTELSDFIVASNEKICATDCDEEAERLEAEVEAASDEYDALDKARPFLIPEEDRPHVGAFVVISKEGEPVLDPRFFTTAKEKRSSSTSRTVAGGETGASQNDLPRKLGEQLARDRRDVLAMHIAQDPGVALDLTIFNLARRFTGQPAYNDTGCTVTISDLFEPAGLSDAPASAAILELDSIQSGLPADWAAHETSFECFLAFRKLDEADKAAWLAYAVSQSLKASLASGDHANAFQTALGAMLEIDTARHWRPGAENFFDRIRKPQILSILGEFDGQLPGRFSGSKKPELAAAAAKLCSGDVIVEPDVKARAIAWIPEVMGFPAAEAADDTIPGPDLAENSGEAVEPFDDDGVHDDAELDSGVNDASAAADDEVLIAEAA